MICIECEIEFYFVFHIMQSYSSFKKGGLWTQFTTLLGNSPRAKVLYLTPKQVNAVKTHVQYIALCLIFVSHTS